jgi:cell wall-associated NlpC family hydrolase
MFRNPFLLRNLLLLGTVLTLAACGTEPYRPTQYASPSLRNTERYGLHHERKKRQQVIAAAMKMIGVPYRYGGTSPRRGFDCSGLVQYAHRQAGLNVPRTTRQLYQAIIPVPRAALQPGDLVFFRIRGPRYISHVGIYLGKGEFIHAPSTGKRVSIANLNDHYWRRHYAAGGRIF